MQPATLNANSSVILPDWKTVALEEDILREPLADGRNIALWLRGNREEGYQYWDRVNNVPHAEFAVEPGVFATAATAVTVRYPSGLVGKLLGKLKKSDGGRSWVLPTGTTAEQWGERQSDLLMVWSTDASIQLDEAYLKTRWPQSEEAMPLGKNLFLVVGVAPPTVAGKAEPGSPAVCPRQVAEQLLAAAREAGDRRKEVTALIDLGLIDLYDGKIKESVVSLEEARSLAQQMGDAALERDVLSNLGLALMTAGQLPRAIQILDQEVAHARAAGDRFGEKLALERLGHAFGRMGQPSRAIGAFEPALAMARDLKHEKHEAQLSWYLAIQLAELGRRDEAIAAAESAIRIMEAGGNPEAAWFAEHLKRFRTGDSAEGLAGPEESGPGGLPGAFVGGSFVTGFGVPMPPTSTPGSPGLLRMALSAAKAMAKFVGTGMKTTAAPDLQTRLRTCAACEHHTGLRCRLCGCFTSVKTRMAHERCPIGKWPA